MNKSGKKLLAVGLSGCMLLSLAACGQGTPSEATQANAKEQEAATTKKIGVAIYSLTDDEVNMFRTYYENYLESAFEVEFLYSPKIDTIEDEKEFVDMAKEEGCEGIISFVTNDLEEIVDYCGDDFYYAMGSGTVSEEAFDAVKDNESFLGIIGPSGEDEYNAGADMIKNFSETDGSQKTYLLMSGGAGLNNYMHKVRLQGMVETLEKEDGFTFKQPFEELAAITEPVLAAESADGGKVYVAPGYFYSDEGQKKLIEALKLDEIDVLTSVCSLAEVMDIVTEHETEQNKDIQVGAVGCFSELSQNAFNEKDAFGNSTINYLAGKCQAMAAPAFIAMYNAVTGYPEVYRNNNQAYWLNQGFWTATNAKEFDELASEAQNVYQNSYGTSEMMENVKIFNEGANFEGFKEFVESL